MKILYTYCIANLYIRKVYFGNILYVKIYYLECVNKIHS